MDHTKSTSEPAWADYFREMARTGEPPSSSVMEAPPSPASSISPSGFDGGFVVHAPAGPVTVSWGSFLGFVCAPENVAHLPAEHPMALFARLARERQAEPTPPSAVAELSPIEAAAPHYAWTAPPTEPVRLADATPRYASVPTLRPYARPGPIQPQQPRVMIPHPYQEIYIWSHRQEKLWRLDSAEGSACVGDINNKLLVFPPYSTIAVRDRDGALASPAWSSCHGSNVFIKGQRCGRHCSYAAGFGNKRPVLIREHLRRCTSLAPDHPLKVLATLELEAHARQTAAAGGVKRKRRSSGASTPRSRSSLPPQPIAPPVEPQLEPPPPPHPPSQYVDHYLGQASSYFGLPEFDASALDNILNSMVVHASPEPLHNPALDLPPLAML